MKPTPPVRPPRQPLLLRHTLHLQEALRELSVEQIQDCMGVSASLAAKTADLIANWTAEPSQQSLAIDCFVGDMYSGLRAGDMSEPERDYADQVLRILSGLYGVLLPYDGVYPYRLEMGYRIPLQHGPARLAAFWGSHIAQALRPQGLVINLSSDEYTNAVLPFMAANRVVTPRFLTQVHPLQDPVFVVVHAKIARGAFARWLIQTRIQDPSEMTNFQEIGYRFDAERSTADQPVFVAREFGGKGLSIRLRS